MNSITIQIINNNDLQKLEKALNSISHLGEIIVADLYANNDCAKLVDKFGKYYKVKNNHRANLRNRLAQESLTTWQMYIEPWETFNGDLPELIKDAYYLNVISNNILTKEIRIWNKDKLSFINPIHEKIVANGSILDNFILSDGSYQSDLSVIKQWKVDNPKSDEPVYYEAFYYLKEQQWDDFIRLADHYLFNNNKTRMSTVMIKYYLAMVYCYVNKDAQKALRHVLEILAVKPLMAELWCLLGDIHVLIAQYKKAKQFYENAIIFGQRRLNDDLYPMDISKYSDYPNRRIKELNL
jgi:tetratricopeptide (TPR) repeat protein